MPTLACPVCATPTLRRIESPSKYAAVNYYRCDGCNHVWAVSKNDPTDVAHVTPPPAPTKKP